MDAEPQDDPRSASNPSGPVSVLSRFRDLLQRDLVLLLVLLALAAGLRGWQMAHTEVTSSDSLAFIRYAWRLEHHPWPEVIQTTNRHPGYPVTILAVSRVVRTVAEGPDALLMQWSAQLASALASVLLVLPMYYLGRELFDRFVAFWACALFQLLPTSCQVLGDGLSESLFLLLAVAGLLAAVRGLRTGALRHFVLCGVFGGLAYLTRPEGALVVGGTGLVLLGCQWVPAWRRSWGQLLASGLSLTLAAVAVGGPFVAVTGRVTVKPTARALYGPRAENIPSPLKPFAPPVFASADDSVTAASHTGRWWRGLLQVGAEIVEGYFYVAWVPLVLGLWWFRDRFRLMPGAWVLLVACGILVLLLWRMAAVLGYVSNRHLLLVILCGTFWGVAGARELCRRLPLPSLAKRPHLASILLLVVSLAALSRSLVPPHPERAGYRAAGAWLAEHTQPSDSIVDPFSWAAFHSGKLLQEKQRDPALPQDQCTRYVVLPRPISESSRRSRIAEALKLAEQGKEVYRFSTPTRKRPSAEVVIYAVPALDVP